MYEDLDRPPLRVPALVRALEPEGWRVEVLAETASTNAVVGERARAGEPAGLVVVAEQQSAGRGRLDRAWVSPPRAGLTFSVLLRPEAVVGWLPLLTGLAVARALRARAGVDAVLKWPNDVLIGDLKVAGILAEVPEPGAVVLGIGLNVTTRQDELPVETATSLKLAGASTTDRDTLLRAVLRELRQVLAEEPYEDYRKLCGTLGRQVRIELPSGDPVVGRAETVDRDGRLVLDGTAYGAGDVVHLR
ncbi:MAG: biotin--[acetyl-CoA-carboxylase] ligase [Actinobacteria bacterium]|nr:biotin--[acetyl-CoA-carboxylase] ligase [Actinomycetota bacterium]MCA1720215.1 biotin--[acetyl-CoA-carboxylase] ligase [Actinomycetota bacterium]